MIRYDRKKECCNVPYSVNISVTEKCPLKCPFCFHEYDNDNEDDENAEVESYDSELNEIIPDDDLDDVELSEEDDDDDYEDETND